MRFIVKLAYLPFQKVFGIVVGRVSKRAFAATWKHVDGGEKPPAPLQEDASLAKAVGGAALQAASRSAGKVIAERASARTFRHLFGIWPGK
jgi:hypothetical protein